VSVIDRVKQAAKIRRLRRALSQNPSPQAYSELAELYIRKGLTDEALQTAVEGLELYPNARKLLEVSRFAKRQELQDRIRLLDETLRARPHPNVYTELASIYWDLGDDTRAEDICRQCTEAFPNNENPYLIVGEIRLERFLAEGLERDGTRALESLEKVVSLNHNNVKCHLLLARLFHAAGDLGRCCSHLRAMLSITPTAREIREFLTGIESRVNGNAGDALEIDELLGEIQRTGRFANDPADFPSVKGTRGTRQESRLDIEELRMGMSELTRAPGIHRAVVLDGEGEILLESGDVATPTRSVFTTLVKSVGETAFDLSRRMDIGTMEQADIMGPFGAMRIIRLPGVLCCALGENARSTGKAMDEFVARSFATRKAVGNA
jgi:tetratricopeptide (TPR) repeat protein